MNCAPKIGEVEGFGLNLTFPDHFLLYLQLRNVPIIPFFQIFSFFWSVPRFSEISFSLTNLFISFHFDEANLSATFVGNVKIWAQIGCCDNFLMMQIPSLGERILKMNILSHILRFFLLFDNNPFYSRSY